MRVFGTVVRIEERKAENTPTAFRLEILCRANYRAADTIDKPDLMSRLYFSVRAFSSNFLLADHVPIFLGEPVCGVVVANYSGSGRSQLDCWKPVAMTDWHLASPTPVYADRELDFGEWADEWTLARSGSPYALGGTR